MTCILEEGLPKMSIKWARQGSQEVAWASIPAAWAYLEFLVKFKAAFPIAGTPKTGDTITCSLLWSIPPPSQGGRRWVYRGVSYMALALAKLGLQKGSPSFMSPLKDLVGTCSSIENIRKASVVLQVAKKSVPASKDWEALFLDAHRSKGIASCLKQIINGWLIEFLMISNNSLHLSSFFFLSSYTKLCNYQKHPCKMIVNKGFFT